MKNKIIIILIFLIGITLIIIPALKQPLWLDEVYSLYFANSFSPNNILFNLPETHPGGYYLLIKFLLNFTTSTFILRLISSVIPQLIGCYLIYKHTHNRFLTALLLLNPFFIHYGWQMRMYGITFLLSAILYIIYSKKHNHEFFIFSLFTIISTLFSFSLIIPISILCLYQIIYKHQKKYFIPLIIIPLEFFALKGITTYKNYAELASWISPPTFSNIPNLLYTLLGFNLDINNLQKFSIIDSVLFYTISIPVIYIFTKNILKLKLFFTIPLIITIIVSIIFPIISQRFFFYHFIPKLSLFVPRFLIPISLFFFISIYTKLSKRHSKILLFLLIILWINPYIKLNYNYNHIYSSVKPISQVDNSIFLPPWENLRLTDKYSLIDIKNISQAHDSALVLEKNLFQSDPNCDLYHHFYQVKYIEQSIPSLSNYQNIIKQNLNYCSTISL